MQMGQKWETRGKKDRGIVFVSSIVNPDNAELILHKPWGPETLTYKDGPRAERVKNYEWLREINSVKYIL